MKKIDFNIEQILKELSAMQDNIKKLSFLKSKHYNNEKTMVIVVDMINGFVREGVFKNPKAEFIIPKIEKLIRNTSKSQLAFVKDNHTINTIEFKTYPTHAIEGTSESEIINELKPYINDKTLVIPKNSTNAFFSPVFAKHLSENYYENFIICGVCSDICIAALATSLKQYLNQWNINSKVIIPLNCIETYDSLGHSADLMNLFTINQFISNGIEVVKEIK